MLRSCQLQRRNKGRRLPRFTDGSIPWMQQKLLGEGQTPMKEQRVRCKQCGQRFTVVRFERERTSAYCDLCRDERKRDQARERMRAWRQHQRGS